MSYLMTHENERIKQLILSDMETYPIWCNEPYNRDGSIYEWNHLHYANDPCNYNKPLYIVVAIYFDIINDTFGLVYRKEIGEEFSEWDEEDCPVIEDLKVDAIIHGARLHRELEQQIALEKLDKQARVSLADERF